MNTTICPNDIPKSHNGDPDETFQDTRVCQIPSGKGRAGQPIAIRTIACPARGVCDTHTPQSAYFQIPQDCEHGASFVCSHDLCRESGRFFRYCGVCDQIAAKRNFTKRHAHLIVPRSPTCPAEMTSMADSVNCTNRKKRRKLIGLEVGGDSGAGVSCIIIDPKEGASTSEDDPSTSNTSTCMLVPRFHHSTVYTSGNATPNPSMHRMKTSGTEANLIERFRLSQNYEGQHHRIYITNKL